PILALADAFHKAHGHWPYKDSGPIDGCPGETWYTIDRALERGRRGLHGGKSLSYFLNQHRGIFGVQKRRPPRLREDKRLDLKQIQTWGQAYFKWHGVFPNRESGRIRGAGDLKWK